MKDALTSSSASIYFGLGFDSFFSSEGHQGRRRMSNKHITGNKWQHLSYHAAVFGFDSVFASETHQGRRYE